MKILDIILTLKQNNYESTCKSNGQNNRSIEGEAVWEDISGISTTPIQYTSDELEFLDFPEMPIAANIPDYWTRLEHTYAGMAMQGLMTILPNIGGLKGRTPKDEIVDIATSTSHALVEKLKEMEERK